MKNAVFSGIKNKFNGFKIKRNLKIRDNDRTICLDKNKLIKNAVLILFFLIISFFLSCSSSMFTDYTKSGFSLKSYKPGKLTESLSLSFHDQPVNFNPYLAITQTETFISNLLFDSLIMINPQTNVLDLHYLASFIYPSDNKRTAEIRLKSGYLSADDVVSCFQFFTDQKSTLTDIELDYFHDIEYEIISEQDFKIKFNSDNEQENNYKLFKILSSPVFPPDLVNKLRKNNDYFFNLFTLESLRDLPMTGPFLIHDYSSETIILTANPSYPFKDKKGNNLPYLQSVKLFYYSNGKKEMGDFINGKLDLIFINETDLQILQKYKSSINIGKILNPLANSVFYLNIPSINDNLKNIIIDSIASGFNNAESPEKNGYWFMLPFSSKKFPLKNKEEIPNNQQSDQKDLSLRKNLLTISVLSDDPMGLFIADRIQNILETKGFKTEIKKEDVSTSVAKIYSGVPWQIFIMNLNYSDWNRPDIFVFQPDSPSHIINLSKTKTNQEYSLYNSAMNIWNLSNYISISKRKGIYSAPDKINDKIEKFINNLSEFGYILPIYSSGLLFSSSKKLQNFSPVFYHDFFDLSFPKILYLWKK